MKKPAKKLKLKRETIRNLTTKELTNVAGGGFTKSLSPTCLQQTTSI